MLTQKCEVKQILCWLNLFSETASDFTVLQDISNLTKVQILLTLTVGRACTSVRLRYFNLSITKFDTLDN